MKEKQQYYQRTESLLYKYEFIKDGIESMEEEFRAEQLNYGLGSVDPGKENFRTNKFSSTVENAVIQRNYSDKVQNLKTHIYNNKKLIKKIDKVMKKLTDDEKEIIKLYYFQGLEWHKVAAKMHYCDKTCSTKRNRAITKIAIGLAFAVVVEIDKEQEAV